jgi:hypothetical protein
MKKKVVVEIECDEKACGYCEWGVDGDLSRHCGLYNFAVLLWHKGDNKWPTRCKQCLEAEVKE